MPMHHLQLSNAKSLSSVIISGKVAAFSIDFAIMFQLCEASAIVSSIPSR